MAKKISCIREEVNQQQIDDLHSRINNHIEEFDEYAQHLGLIGNAVRLKILKLISENKLCVCDLSDILDMSIPAVSQHLRKLKDAKLIVNQREGQTIYNFVSKNVPQYITRILNEIKL